MTFSLRSYLDSRRGGCELSCLSCLVHSHMLVPAVTFSPQAPRSADPLGIAKVSAPLGKVSEWIVLAFRCTVRFLPEAALLKLCSRVNLPDPAPSCCFETVTWVRPVSIHNQQGLKIAELQFNSCGNRAETCRDMQRPFKAVCRWCLVHQLSTIRTTCE